MDNEISGSGINLIKGGNINNIQQALILAGGEGTRLQPITERIPKSMVEVNGRPFLEYQFELLVNNGINEAVLCVGHLWEHIKDYFGGSFRSRSGDILKLQYSVEQRLLGTGGAILNAKQFLNDYFFLINGDTYLIIECQKLGQLIIERQMIGVTAVYSNPDNIAKNNIHINEEGIILEYNKHQDKSELNGLEAGVAIFSENLLDYFPDTIPANQKISLEIDIYPKLITQKKLLGFITTNRFYDMGTLERLKIISEVLK